MRMPGVAMLCLLLGSAAGSGSAESSGPAGAAAPSALPPLPVAPKRPVFDTYWGINVEDDYQYLENTSDPEVMDWAAQQNTYTRAWMDAHPERERILERVVALTHSTSPEYFGLVLRNGVVFASKRQPPHEQPMIVTFPGLNEIGGESRGENNGEIHGERVLVDPGRLDPTGGTSADFYVPSLDGRLLAVSLSQGGTEEGTVHVFDVAGGTELPDRIPRVNGGTAGGSLAWNTDGSGFYYTRYPQPGERPPEDLSFYQQVWFHRLGDPLERDTYVIGRDFPKIAEIGLETSEDGRFVLIDVSNGDGGEHAYWILQAGGARIRESADQGTRETQHAAQITRFEDQCVDAGMAPDGMVYLLSRRDAPNGKLLRVDPAAPELSRAQTIVPESDAAIEGYAATASKLYVIEMQGGPTRVGIYDRNGKRLGSIDRDEPSSFSGIVRTGGDAVLLRIQSYTVPPAFYRYDPDTKQLARTALVFASPADFSDCEVRREFATAQDGTKIPVNIILKKGTPLDGRNPALLTAYGSYGMNQTPSFDAGRKVWIEQGGIVAVANIRGGGEFGERWHHAAWREKKKTSMDDFAACGRYLIEKGYTSHDKLAIQGGSAGGLLMYGVLVHYPDLAHAVVAHVGYGDALRTELSPNGRFNTTEFGTVTDSTQFRGMYAYSPYHHVRDGVQYPAVLATTGLNDPRVEPWQSFKMVARLQATGTRLPILLRTSAGAGHGGGTALSVRDQQTADTYTFLFTMLGVNVQ